MCGCVGEGVGMQNMKGCILQAESREGLGRECKHEHAVSYGWAVTARGWSSLRLNVPVCTCV